jgi:histidine triad (HIT) family protein
MSCVFCEIIAGQAPAAILYEDERVVIFRDHKPHARIHLLVCTRNHYATFLDAPAEEVTYVIKVCRALADKLKVQNGFRLLINNGPQGGQIIFHLHMHFMAWVGELPEGRIELELD